MSDGAKIETGNFGIGIDYGGVGSVVIDAAEIVADGAEGRAVSVWYNGSDVTAKNESILTSTGDKGSALFTYNCDADITIDTSTVQNTSAGGYYGIIGGSGDIEVKGESVILSSGIGPAIWSDDTTNTVTISGGTITGKGHYGILFTGDIEIAGLCTVAGFSGAFSKEPTVSITDKYAAKASENLTGSPVDSTEENAYTFKSTHKYVEFVKLTPSATVEDVTVSGTVGQRLPSSSSIKLKIENDEIAAGVTLGEFTAATREIFTNAPAGINIGVGTPIYGGVTEITFNVSRLDVNNVPTEALSAPMDITIPGGFLKSGKDITAEENPNAKWDIKPAEVVPGTATVEDVTVSGTVGKSLGTGYEVTINIEGDELAWVSTTVITDLIDEIFANAPGGMFITLAGGTPEDTSIKFKIELNSVPETVLSEPMELILPGEILAGGKDITVTTNPNAKWDIKATPPSESPDPPADPTPTPAQTGETGWVHNDDGSWSYRQEEGLIESDWLDDNGNWYYFDPEDKMVTGWQLTGGKWYYLNPGGNLAGWTVADKHENYRKPLGAMVTGWLKWNASWYYLRNNGEMATGWVKDGPYWYYLKPDGKMATGWLKDPTDGKWYYLRGGGEMIANDWPRWNGKWYWLKSSGAMAENEWIEWDEKWYRLKSGGVMAESEWVQLNGRWYFLRSGGRMAANTRIRINGRYYRFNANGVMQGN